MIRTSRVVAAALLVASVAAAQAPASKPFELDSLTITGFRWRNVGPANTMGRMSDVTGIPSPSKTFFAAAAAGGIWKSTNNGVTWRPVFDNQRVISMGMLAIAPSDTMQVWAGTGEPNSRNTISPGGGVYKSTDGGITWKSMGLEKTQAIGRIVVHPTNPNIVYVAALGAPWNANPERGLYKTEDGGQTWQLIKFISDKAGFVDVALDPANPNTVWASSWQRVRGPYFLNSGGPGSALWKSADAGKTWTEIKGGGFPETTKGRIGISISRSNPQVMYTLVEADTVPNPKPEKGKPAAKSPSGLYRSNDGGATWARTNDQDTRPFYYSQVRVHPKNPERVYWSSTPVLVSNDGGKTVINATNGIHVDHHAMWIDPVDPDRMIVGDDGGVAISFDQGGTYMFANMFAVGQLYNISYDFQVPYRVCGGLQDNGSWCGPSRRRQGPITNAMWFTVGGGDGFVTQQDPTDPNTIYAESQGGAIVRLNYATGQSSFLVKPQYRQRYDMYEDSVLIERGDTAAPQTAAQKKAIADIRAHQKTDSAALDLRFNWNTPYLISPHNPSTLYVGGNRVLKSTKRGDDLFSISPDLSTADTMKIRVSTRTTGGITNDATGAETYCTVVSLNESPIRAGILYAGTDDGRLWVTRNDGGTWEELTTHVTGVPAGTYVTRIEPSPHDSMTFFVTYDNHRNGDYKPYVFVTHDFGKTFSSIAANLPVGGPDYVHVIRQDLVNKNLLFLGTDVGAYVSVNGGQSWQRFMTGLPTVPVHDLRIHPRDHEIIAATHGRGIWIADISALQQIDEKVMAEDAHLFSSPTGFQFGDPPVEGQSQGHQVFQGASPPYGTVITYRLAARQPQAKIAILDAAGDTMQVLNGPGAAGINRVAWAYGGKPAPRRALGAVQKRDSALQMNRIVFVLDSLDKAGANQMMTGMMRQLVHTGDFSPIAAMFTGRGGTPGFGAPPPWNPRPGEQATGAAAMGGGRGGAPGGAQPGAPAAAPAAPGVAGAASQVGTPAAAAPAAAAAAMPLDPAAMQQWAPLFNIPGRPPAGGFGLGFMQTLGFGDPTAAFFGGTGGSVAAGDYVAVMTVNGKTLRQKIRVEKSNP
jgi:photosystem II stability/assembly factor-like uncharacterized protein